VLSDAAVWIVFEIDGGRRVFLQAASGLMYAPAED
jgi:hypothetical protein